MVADVNRDGRLDLVITSFHQRVEWLEMPAAGPLSGPWTRRLLIQGFPEDEGGYRFFAADFDGDGWNDVIRGRALYRNGGGALPTFTRLLLPDPVPLAAGDLDGDGDLDLAGLSGWQRQVGKNPLAFEQRPYTFRGADAIYDLTLADVDGDSDLDVLYGFIPEESEYRLQWNENLGRATPSFEAHLAEEVSNFTPIVGAPDLVRDGVSDLLISGNLAWLENQPLRMRLDLVGPQSSSHQPADFGELRVRLENLRPFALSDLLVRVCSLDGKYNYPTLCTRSDTLVTFDRPQQITSGDSGLYPWSPAGGLYRLRVESLGEISDLAFSVGFDGYTCDASPADTYFHPVQRTNLFSGGEGYQELCYDFATGGMWVTPYQSTTGPVYYHLPEWHWTGIFHYDYASSRFTQAHYRVKSDL